MNTEDRRLPLAVVVASTLLVLLPFLNKAYHIDDLLFVATARQILQHPMDFFGFSINWYGKAEPIAGVNLNPPLVSYYLALFIRLFGEKETVLHAALLLPAIGLATGVYFLSRYFCSNVLLPALFVIATPVFVVSSTNVMSDTLMICFYVWSIYLWLRGLHEDRFFLTLLSGLCISMAFLAKYFGFTAGILLLVYTLSRQKGLHRSLLSLLLPAAVLAFYQGYTIAMYGNGLLFNAATVSLGISMHHNMLQLGLKTLIGTAFTGGCLLPVLFFVPFLAKGDKTFRFSLPFLLAIAVILAIMAPKFGLSFPLPGRLQSGKVILHLAVYLFVGLVILCLAVTDLVGKRTSESLLLFCWVLGTMFFTTYLNWTTNARTVFPMAPAVAILVVRRIENFSPQLPIFSWKMLFPLFPSLILALTVGQADYALANIQRSAARQITTEFHQPGKALFFQGHWGFQYYMEKEMARPIEFQKDHLTRGDLIVIPVNNTGTKLPSPKDFTLIKKFIYQPLALASTMDHLSGKAGFYSDVWGELPFAFGRSMPEGYLVMMHN